MNSQTKLLRQVHPQFIIDGQLTSQAFCPFPKDAGQLSVYDGDMISAAESYRHYTEALKYASDSVWGVTCAEVVGVGLTCASDPQPDFPSHSVINFIHLSDKDCRKLAKTLKRLALARGRLHPPL